MSKKNETVLGDVDLPAVKLAPARVKLLETIKLTGNGAVSTMHAGGVFSFPRGDAIALVADRKALPVDDEEDLVAAVPAPPVHVKHRMVTSEPVVVIGNDQPRRLSTKDGEHVRPARTTVKE